MPEIKEKTVLQALKESIHHATVARKELLDAIIGYVRDIYLFIDHTKLISVRFPSALSTMVAGIEGVIIYQQHGKYYARLVGVVRPDFVLNDTFLQIDVLLNIAKGLADDSYWFVLEKE